MLRQTAWIVSWCLSAAIAWAAPAPAPAPPAHAITSAAGGRELTFDFPGVEIGTAQYEDGPTGTTVLYFPKHALVAVDVRGGAPGTINSDAARLEADEGFVSAVVLSGGSAYGLSAATGVSNALKDRSPDPGNWRNVAVVLGAIIFDVGDRRYNAITPDDALGRAALANAVVGRIPLGAVGGGRFALQGGYFDRQYSGQGAAFRQIGDTKILVVTIVNAVGSIVDRAGNVARCSHPVNGSCGPISERLSAHLAALGAPKKADVALQGGDGLTANTTITAVITNQAMSFGSLQRLGIQVHNSMARAIQPFGTQFDGDTLFAVSTAEVKNSPLPPIVVATAASEVAWDAILASLPELPPPAASSGARPTAAFLEAAAGHYEFVPGVTADVVRRGDALEITVTGRDSMYLPAGKPTVLEPVSASAFELKTPRADPVEFDVDRRGKVEGFTISPHGWPVHARRVPAK